MVIKQLKLPKSTVYDAVRRYKELGNTKNRPKSGRPRSCRTKSNIKAVRERVRRNPGTQKGEIVFSDEKMVTVEAKFNPQNDECWPDTQRTFLRTCYPFIAAISQHLSCFGRQCQNLEISPDFCEAGCQTKHKCEHR